MPVVAWVVMLLSALPVDAWVRVPLSLDGCEGRLSPSEIIEALNVELSSTDPALLDYLARRGPRATVHCGADAVDVEVLADGVRFTDRLVAPESALARAAAIAIAEAVAAHATRPAPPAVVAPPGIETQPAPPNSTSLLWLGGAAGASWSGAPGFISAVATAALRFEFATAASATARLDVGHGAQEVARGRITANTVSLGVGAAWRVQHSENVALDAGGGLRGGVAAWAAEATEAEDHGLSGAGPWAGGFIGLEGLVTLRSALRLSLRAEAGRMILTSRATAGRDVLVDLGPMWLNVGIGLETQLD